MNNPNIKQCPNCEGNGQIPIGEHYVTREMSLDAEEPIMEGHLYDIEYTQCKRCEGTGEIKV